MADSLITDEMRAAVGAVVERRVSYPIAASDIRRWALAVHWPEEPPRVHWDEAYAAQTAHGGIVAPEDFNPFAWMAAEPAGLPSVDPMENDVVEKQLGIAPTKLPVGLNGGVEAEYGERMRPGDTITSVRTLAAYREREGRFGPMLFTVLEDVWTNAAGALVKRETTTSIRY